MKQLLIFLSLVIISLPSWAQKKSPRKGYYGGYVVKKSDIDKSKNLPIQEGDFILTHNGYHVQSEFDQALVKEAIRTGTIKKYSTLTTNKSVKKAILKNRK